MNVSRALLAGLGLVIASAVSGCAGGSAEPVEELIVDELESLEDGQFKAWKLEPGTYKVEMTASGDGAKIKWVGSSCPGSESATDQYSTICEMKQTGQLIVENPTSFGLGAGTTVTMKVTKVAD